MHEYGGGAWWLGAQSIYFANWDDQRLYRLAIDAELGTEPEPITPSRPSRGLALRRWPRTPDGDWLVCVRERHPAPGANGRSSEAVNELVAIALDGREPAEPRTIAVSPESLDADIPAADFVAEPRFSPDGRWLSWIRWNHPRMPWDGTELCVAPVFAGMKLGNTQVVAGNEHESIQGAGWMTEGRLVFSTDRSGFWNLHAWTPGSRRGSAADGPERLGDRYPGLGVRPAAMG